MICVAIACSASTAFATDFTCTFVNKEEAPLIVYLTQIYLQTAKGQFTIAGQKPVGLSVKLRNNVLTMFGSTSGKGSEDSYLVTVALGKKQPFQVMYSLHMVSKVDTINLTLPIGFERDGTCEATD
ncbi:hypothetical protein ACE04B_36795 [Rhizobium phaseoli]